MALDPISAVGLGAGILQFVDFTAKLLSVAREVRETADGATVENCDLEAVTRSLVWLTERLSEPKQEWSTACRSRQFQSSADLDIDELGSGCEGIAKDLLDALQKLKSRGKVNKWKSMLQALRSVWAKGKIDNLRTRLEQYRSGIHTALLVSLR